MIAEMKALKAKVALLEREVKENQVPQINFRSNWDASKGPRFQGNRKGCPASASAGVGDNCRHCRKCGSDSHFSFDCPKRNHKNQRNGQSLLGRDPQQTTIAIQKSPIRVGTVIKQRKIRSYFDLRDAKPGGTVAKRAKTRDWDDHNEICKTIQALAIRYNPPDLGKGDSEDEQAYKTHLTPKQHSKVVKLVGGKCNVKCKLNNVELSVLWDTAAQINLFSTTQLKKYFGDMELYESRSAGHKSNITQYCTAQPNFSRADSDDSLH